MRKIQFRAQCDTTDEWIYGFPLKDADIKNRWYIVFNYASMLDKIIVKPETIGEYSGMKDKKKEPIFEGDILDCINADGKQIRVVCKFGEAKRKLMSALGIVNECSIFGFYLDYKGLATYPIVNNYKGLHDLEILNIVGNIFDNPELLKSTK